MQICRPEQSPPAVPNPSRLIKSLVVHSLSNSLLKCSVLDGTPIYCSPSQSFTFHVGDKTSVSWDWPVFINFVWVYPSYIMYWGKKTGRWICSLISLCTSTTIPWYRNRFESSWCIELWYCVRCKRLEFIWGESSAESYCPASGLDKGSYEMHEG